MVKLIDFIIDESGTIVRNKAHFDVLSNSFCEILSRRWLLRL